MVLDNSIEKLCASADNTIDFYSSDDTEITKAVELCESCPFRKACLQVALDNNEVWGVWGGATAKELRRDQSLDADGKPLVYANMKIRCPYCGPHSTKFLTVLTRKRVKTEVHCSNCGLTWWVRKLIRKSLNF